MMFVSDGNISPKTKRRLEDRSETNELSYKSYTFIILSLKVNLYCKYSCAFITVFFACNTNNEIQCLFICYYLYKCHLWKTLTHINRCIQGTSTYLPQRMKLRKHKSTCILSQPD